jgi:hypothetical protein
VNGLDAASRDALERAILKGRQVLEGDLAEAAEGRLGIYADGTIDSEDALRLPPGELGQRREVVEVVTHLRREGETAEGAVGRLIREAAFTHLNRLVAIRVAEAIDLLAPSLAQGRASQGFRDMLEVAPLLAADATGGYWIYLRLCGDELAADDPVLFDPRNPLLALAPSPAALDKLVEILADPKLANAWAAPDTFGWAYQFFNTGDERRQMRDESSAPRTSRELAVRNQFFTPRYVVDFLVQNSLGRRLVEADPASSLVDKLPLLIDPPSTRRQPLPLDEVRVLDPACGSGHFLLGCYDLLELAWQQVGVKPAEAAARILPCLWGIDIDPRCAQVASAALMLRARRACREGDLPRPNVLTARALPEDPEAWERALAGLSSTHRKLVASLRDGLAQAPVLGPLLKVEERLAADLHRNVPEAGGEDTLFGAAGVAAAAMDQAEGEVLAAVQRVADEASSSAAERLLAAEATDAIRFVEAMRQRYDAVLMNPPFGEPVTETKPYLRAEYESIPSTADLLAAFVGRGLALLESDGYLGAVTSRAGMFLTTFNRWREKVLLNHLVTLADLGFGVMEGANVEAAAYVLSADQRQPDDESVFLRLLKATDRPKPSLRRSPRNGRATALHPCILFVQTSLARYPDHHLPTGRVLPSVAYSQICRCLREVEQRCDVAPGRVTTLAIFGSGGKWIREGSADERHGFTTPRGENTRHSMASRISLWHGMTNDERSVTSMAERVGLAQSRRTSAIISVLVSLGRAEPPVASGSDCCPQAASSPTRDRRFSRNPRKSSPFWPG